MEKEKGIKHGEKKEGRGIERRREDTKREVKMREEGRNRIGK